MADAPDGEELARRLADAESRLQHHDAVVAQNTQLRGALAAAHAQNALLREHIATQTAAAAAHPSPSSASLANRGGGGAAGHSGLDAVRSRLDDDDDDDAAQRHINANALRIDRRAAAQQAMSEEDEVALLVAKQMDAVAAGLPDSDGDDEDDSDLQRRFRALKR
jgi:hypothetical protein